MLCSKCGSQIPEGSMFCPVCGTQVQQAGGETVMNNGGFQAYQPFSVERDQNSVAAKVRKMLSSNLFLGICILLTVPAIPVGGLPILAILFAVGAWIAYAKAKSSDATMNLSGLNLISGTMTASYILLWVAVGCMALGGILMLFTGPMMSSLENEMMAELEAEGLWEMIEQEAAMLTGEEQEIFYWFMDLFINNLSMIFMALGGGVLALAVIYAVYNAVFYGRFRKLAKNMGAAYITNNASVLNFKGVAGMLMAVGIINAVFNGLGFLGGEIIGSISGICTGVAFILAANWVKQLKASLEAPAVPTVNADFRQQSDEMNVL